LNCPVCNQPMIILELDQVEVDYCVSCYGVWLDEGELELLLQDSDEKNKLFKSFIIDKANKERPVKCPICSKKMDKTFCGDENKVIIDECPRKHGLWFNKGELQSAVEMGSLDKQNKIVKLLKEMFFYNLK